jgi:hypothetical protein
VPHFAAHRKKTTAEALVEEHYESVNPRGTGGGAKRATGDDEASSSGTADDSEDELGTAHKRQKRMLRARDAASADLLARNKSTAALRDQPLEARAQAEAGGEVRRRTGGYRDVTFVPRCVPLYHVAGWQSHCSNAVLSLNAVSGCVNAHTMCV